MKLKGLSQDTVRLIHSRIAVASQTWPGKQGRKQNDLGDEWRNETERRSSIDHRYHAKPIMSSRLQGQASQ